MGGVLVGKESMGAGRGPHVLEDERLDPVAGADRRGAGEAVDGGPGEDGNDGPVRALGECARGSAAEKRDHGHLAPPADRESPRCVHAHLVGGSGFRKDDPEVQPSRCPHPPKRVTARSGFAPFTRARRSLSPTSAHFLHAPSDPNGVLGALHISFGSRSCAGWQRLQAPDPRPQAPGTAFPEARGLEPESPATSLAPAVPG
jgi:hypothetical protein